MSREEVLVKIRKINKQKGMFLAFGIILIILGVIADIVGGVLIGIKLAKVMSESGNTPNMDGLVKLYTSAEFVIPAVIASICVLGGITLLILRGVVLGRKLRVAQAELNAEPVEEPKEEEPTQE